MIRPLGKLTAGVGMMLAAVLVLSGCTGSEAPSTSRPSGSAPATSASSADAQACADVPDLVVEAVQEYVDGYGSAVAGKQAGPSASPSASPTVGPAGGDTGLRNALSQTRDVLQQRGCDVPTYQRDLQAQLGDVTARGPLAQAVLLRLRASLAGRASEAATTVDAGPGDDLPTVLSELGPGSTVTLAPGRYRLDSSLVLLQGVTLRGAGRGRTTLGVERRRGGDAGADRRTRRAGRPDLAAHGPPRGQRTDRRADVLGGADRGPGQRGAQRQGR